MAGWGGSGVDWDAWSGPANSAAGASWDAAGASWDSSSWSASAAATGTAGTASWSFAGSGQSSSADAWSAAQAGERRIDPADDKVYTYSEIEALYSKQQYRPAEVWSYWLICKVASGGETVVPSSASSAPPGLAAATGEPTEEKRIDPEDGKTRTHKEVVAQYSHIFSKDDIWGYWQSSCKPLPQASASAPAQAEKKEEKAVAEEEEKRLDTEDGKVKTFKEVLHDYGQWFSKENLLDYWNMSCKPIKEEAKAAAGSAEPAKLASPAKAMEYGPLGEPLDPEGEEMPPPLTVKSAPVHTPVAAPSVGGSFSQAEKPKPAAAPAATSAIAPPVAAAATTTNGPAKDAPTPAEASKAGDGKPADAGKEEKKPERKGPWKLDPDDWHVRTWAEIEDKYKAYFSPEDIKNYWNNDCRNLEDHRWDPEDNQVRSYRDMQWKYRGWFSDQEVQDYWDSCVVVTPRPPPKPQPPKDKKDYLRENREKMGCTRSSINEQANKDFLRKLREEEKMRQQRGW